MNTLSIVEHLIDKYGFPTFIVLLGFYLLTKLGRYLAPLLSELIDFFKAHINAQAALVKSTVDGLADLKKEVTETKEIVVETNDRVDLANKNLDRIRQHIEGCPRPCPSTVQTQLLPNPPATLSGSIPR